MAGENDTPPGSALVFEFHEEAQPHTYFVMAIYMTQTLDQIRKRNDSYSFLAPGKSASLLTPDVVRQRMSAPGRAFRK
jgi:hypothetical protein